MIRNPQSIDPRSCPQAPAKIAEAGPLFGAETPEAIQPMTPAETKREAACKVNARQSDRLRAAIVAYVEKTGGATDLELFDHFTAMEDFKNASESTVRARRVECVTGGKLEQSGKARKNRRGSMMEIWISKVRGCEMRIQITISPTLILDGGRTAKDITDDKAIALVKKSIAKLMEKPSTTFRIFREPGEAIEDTQGVENE